MGRTFDWTRGPFTPGSLPSGRKYWLSTSYSITAPWTVERLIFSMAMDASHTTTSGAAINDRRPLVAGLLEYPFSVLPLDDDPLNNPLGHDWLWVGIIPYKRRDRVSGASPVEDEGWWAEAREFDITSRRHRSTQEVRGLYMVTEQVPVLSDFTRNYTLRRTYFQMLWSRPDSLTAGQLPAGGGRARRSPRTGYSA